MNCIPDNRWRRHIAALSFEWRWHLAVAGAVLGGLLSAATVYPASAAAMPGAAGAAGDVWPTFGHDPAHTGVSSDTGIAASTASDLTEQWSASLSSTLDQPSPAVAFSAKLGHNLVYDATYDGAVSAFNAVNGALVWQRSVGSNVASSPAVYNGSVYLGTLDGKLVALNAATGAVRCTFTLPAEATGRLMSSPVVGDVDGTGPTVFIGDAGVEESTNAGHFWAITGVGNTAGGCREKWTYDDWRNRGPAGDRTGVWDEPALARNRSGKWEVVFGTSDPDQSVYALDAVNGSALWRFHTLNDGPDEDVGAGPTIGLPGRNGFVHGVVYIDGKDGVEYALDLQTGKKIWSLRLGQGSGASYGVSEAALTGNTLVVCYGWSVLALKATTGAVIWKHTLGGRIQASPTVSGPSGDQVVFVGDLNGTEHGLKLRNGGRVFVAATSGELQASAAVADGRLYFTSGGLFYAYAPG